MAFYHTYEFEGEKRIGIVRTHNHLEDALLLGTQRRKTKNYVVSFDFLLIELLLLSYSLRLQAVARGFDALALPMTTMPLPWANLNRGPYLILPGALRLCASMHFCFNCKPTRLLTGSERDALW
jgi:hypothetical protein